jgi:hypothetical protein
VTSDFRYLLEDRRLIVLDQYLSKEEINACCVAGDLIAALYRPHPHPSSIVLHAVTAGKMVLAPNNGWFAYMVPKFSVGRLCNPQDPEVLAEALDPALHEAENLQAICRREAIGGIPSPGELCASMEAGVVPNHGQMRRRFSTRLELGLEWIRLEKQEGGPEP